MARGQGSRQASPKRVGSLHHSDKRLNIPTAEMQSFFQREEDHSPLPPKHYPRARPLTEGEQRERDPDRDPQILWNGVRITLTAAQRRQLAEIGQIEIGEAQLVWRGKDVQDWSDLIVQTPPLYIQEKIHPKAIIDDLKRQAATTAEARTDAPDLFADFNGVPKDVAAEFYQHEAHWANRMVLGDSLAVMASLAERERLKGKVQCIYFDPPYGIKFNSNWQVSTRSRDVKDGRQTDISREPEQVKAFRDTWRDGIHSYLTYLRDSLTVARDLLTDSGSIFVQIGDENVHRVRELMDEVFGTENFCSLITVLKTTGAGSPAVSTDVLPSVADYIVWRHGLGVRWTSAQHCGSRRCPTGNRGGSRFFTKRRCRLHSSRRDRNVRPVAGRDRPGSRGSGRGWPWRSSRHLRNASRERLGVSRRRRDGVRSGCPTA
jgi:adenine-specific DNA-methyltransferase